MVSQLAWLAAGSLPQQVDRELQFVPPETVTVVPVPLPGDEDEDTRVHTAQTCAEFTTVQAVKPPPLTVKLTRAVAPEGAAASHDGIGVPSASQTPSFTPSVMVAVVPVPCATQLKLPEQWTQAARPSAPEPPGSVDVGGVSAVAGGESVPLGAWSTPEGAGSRLPMGLDVPPPPPQALTALSARPAARRERRMSEVV